MMKPPKTRKGWKVDFNQNLQIPCASSAKGNIPLTESTDWVVLSLCPGLKLNPLLSVTAFQSKEQGKFAFKVLLP